MQNEKLVIEVSGSFSRVARPSGSVGHGVVTITSSQPFKLAITRNTPAIFSARRFAADRG